MKTNVRWEPGIWTREVFASNRQQDHHKGYRYCNLPITSQSICLVGVLCWKFGFLIVLAELYLSFYPLLEGPFPDFFDIMAHFDANLIPA